MKGVQPRSSNVIDNCIPPIQKLLNDKFEVVRYEEKNVDLLCEILSRFCYKEWSTVIDLYSGTATTALACIRMNHHFIGFEKDDTIAEVVGERLLVFTKSLLEKSLFLLLIINRSY